MRITCLPLLVVKPTVTDFRIIKIRFRHAFFKLSYQLADFFTGFQILFSNSNNYALLNSKNYAPQVLKSHKEKSKLLSLVLVVTRSLILTYKVKDLDSVVYCKDFFTAFIFYFYFYFVCH